MSELDPGRVDAALRHVISNLDYDIHKALERNEETGEDTYHEIVEQFTVAYSVA